MPFLSLSTYNFRNLLNGTIDLSSREVFFVGKNGQGKSNLLESLYYSAYASSFRTHVDSEIIRKNESEMSVRCLFREDSGNSHTTSIIIKEKSKKIEKDGKIIHDRKELVNTVPCVLYSHEDLDFAVGSPERRRFFIDQSLSMYDVFYIDVMRKYKRILKSRNMSLKEGQFGLLDAYDFQLAQNGLEIQKKRKNAVFRFNQFFGNLYEQVTGISGVSIKYIPSWKSQENVPSVDEVVFGLKKSREQEKIMGSSLSGPHRDKIVFEKDKMPFVPTASTGQKRLIALILRTGQAVFYRQITSRKPVLLMDDVMLELDPEKRQKVTSLLPEYDQLFCTFLPGEPYSNYKRENTKVYQIKNGEWMDSE
ncbi:DNA replication/repair protein RecF [Treponema sp.]|uniref:DNA replication/repair protein RecF n=1 Tax=Treponema sp. TaxID=166 RepID=UPI003F129F5E